MNHRLSEFDARRARSLAETLALLAEPPIPQKGPWRPLAGGTDLMVQMNQGKVPPGRYLDISSLSELHGICVLADTIEIGALVTFRELVRHPVIAAEFPLLWQAAKLFGAPTIQSRATVGGNLANASPAADSSPPLLSYNARLLLQTEAETRLVPYALFHLDYKKTALTPGELITKVILPRPKIQPGENAVQLYQKVGTRAAQAISKVSLAARARVREGRVFDVHVSLGSVAPTVRRCPSVEHVVSCLTLDDPFRQAMYHAVSVDISPIGDLRATEKHRRLVAANLCRAFGTAVQHALQEKRFLRS